MHPVKRAIGERGATGVTRGLKAKPVSPFSQVALVARHLNRLPFASALGKMARFEIEL